LSIFNGEAPLLSRFAFLGRLTWWKAFRLCILFGMDLTVLCGAYYLAYYLRFDRWDLGVYHQLFWATLPFYVGANLLCFLFGGMYRQVWRYANVNSALMIGRLVLFGTFISVAIDYWLAYENRPPRSVLVIFCLVSTMGITVVKFSWRIWASFRSKQGKERKRCLIYGAGSAGELFARHVVASSHFPYQPIGFVDDDPNKKGRVIHGLKIYGSGRELASILKRKKINTIIIAIHAAPGAVVRDVFKKCQKLDAQVLIMPDMANALDTEIFKPRAVDIKDLLRRSPAQIDQEKISICLKNKTVLITGAGGSIGSEICRQVASYLPTKLIMLEMSEFNLYQIDLELRVLYPHVEIVSVLGSCTEPDLVAKVFAAHKPEYVLHAAAYKHVPIIEENIEAGILNNIVATRVVADAAVKYKSECFLLISSDKAVRPVNVMGATKRCCELLINSIAKINRTNCKFSSVRFGNVLGSSGSVVPRFLQQIAKGGPVSVTHPDITRYFMLIEEAVGLVLQSVSMSSGGEVFVLNMGNPVKIHEMAKHLIVLSGKTPGKDIEIKFTGLRPGEKLYEELILEGSESHTLHEDVFTARSGEGLDARKTIEDIDLIIQTARESETSKCRDMLFALIRSDFIDKPGILPENNTSIDNELSLH